MQDISTSITETGYFSKNWTQTKIDTTDDLVQIIKTKAYSNAIFEDGKRAGKNIIGFSNYLILDIDNDDTNLTIEECRAIFISKNIASLIIPSRSHRKDKNGSIKDRFRVICYFDKVIPAEITKELYRTSMHLLVTDLKMESSVDTKALNDKSRYYHPSRNLDESFICETTGKKIILDDYLKKATLHNNKIGLLAKMATMRKRSKIATKKRLSGSKSVKIRNLNSKTKIIQPLTNNSEYFVHDSIYKYDLHEISNNIDFMDVVEDYEKIILEEQTSNGIYIKTADKNTYQLFSTNILYDFKNETSFNVYSYIKNHYECSSKEALNHMSLYTNIDSCKSVSEDWQDAIINSLEVSTNSREFQASLISLMGFKEITIKDHEEDIIVIAGKNIHISDFELQEYKTKKDIVKKFQENRKKVFEKK